MKLNSCPTRCPVCPEALQVVELACPACATHLRGRFGLPPLARLSGETQEFVQVFLTCRGNIREVEKVLGVSYPTVRNRLEATIEALGRATDLPASPDSRRQDILAALERGELSASEAIARLEELNHDR